MSRTEESSSGGWDTLLDMIKSGELSLWRQAFAIIEMGVAREWPTSAQLDLIHEIYNVLRNWDMKYKQPINLKIDEIEKNMGRPGYQQYEQEYDELIKLSNEMAREQNDLHALVAELLDIPNSWYYDRTYANDPRRWEELFKKAGIIS